MPRRLLPFLAASVMLVAACSDDEPAADAGATTTADAESTTTTAATATTAAPETTTTTAAGEPLFILVTNDDGVEGEGIDALVTALRDLDDVELIVVAPLENQSGSGDSTSPTPPAVSNDTLLSGHLAIAVEGFPADAVTHALDVLLVDNPPDLVISGINFGQNLGPALDVSGTVGAARTAARRGIPALAVSQGFGDPPAYADGVAETLRWLEQHRDQLAAGTVANLNIPTCPRGTLLGPLFVPADTESTIEESLAEPECGVELEVAPADDVEGFLAGYATLTDDVGLG